LVTADAAQLRAGVRPDSDLPWGYGLQWWLPDDSGATAAYRIADHFVFFRAIAGEYQ
jgi:hypothetical protein